MFRYLSDKELINLLSSKRYHSPIIDELCKRLEEEKYVSKIDFIEKCPICLCKLNIDISIK